MGGREGVRYLDIDIFTWRWGLDCKQVVNTGLFGYTGLEYVFPVCLY